MSVGPAAAAAAEVEQQCSAASRGNDLAYQQGQLGGVVLDDEEEGPVELHTDDGPWGQDEGGEGVRVVTADVLVPSSSTSTRTWCCAWERYVALGLMRAMSALAWSKTWLTPCSPSRRCSCTSVPTEKRGRQRSSGELLHKAKGFGLLVEAPQCVIQAHGGQCRQHEYCTVLPPLVRQVHRIQHTRHVQVCRAMEDAVHHVDHPEANGGGEGPGPGEPCVKGLLPLGLEVQAAEQDCTGEVAAQPPGNCPPRALLQPGVHLKVAADLPGCGIQGAQHPRCKGWQ
eukprot:CAMPEP_0202922912 /NCGR_PEP_ID=MMETSP1392-20130828/78174_1 /ASSEMBLY_ACC=CAM_ASM_000868 /TAXON_ID=225041 /ORGANISM="Chlamydomonas chlamydogama, Strain SAG 11-48b" /LENGTH=283 /DNA_ID=CAMNT_0049616567 /DNA_START=956 /DNA_END=1808 /DNA_ORIENTATION=+